LFSDFGQVITPDTNEPLGPELYDYSTMQRYEVHNNSLNLSIIEDSLDCIISEEVEDQMNKSLDCSVLEDIILAISSSEKAEENECDITVDVEMSLIIYKNNLESPKEEINVLKEDVSQLITLLTKFD